MDIILNTFGTTLIRENENFAILHPDGKQRVPLSDVKSISISRGAQITSDAAIMAIENEIDVLFVDAKGSPLGRVWSVKYGSISNIRRKQLDFSFSANAIDWIKEVMKQKIDNQVALLVSIVPMDKYAEVNFEASLNRLNDYKKKISDAKGDIISDVAPSLRGWEGASAKIYFDVINQILPTEYQFKNRSQHPAMDMFNAMLNYGYGMLYGKIEGALIRAGIDPYVGIFHRNDYNRPVLVYDVIELYRIWVDYVVVNLCLQKALDEDCFSIKSDGSYWLEALGRRILIQSVNDYLSEHITIKSLTRSRETHIELYAQQLAQQFLKFKE
jgi:CRISPR-associated protein Cas1